MNKEIRTDCNEFSLRTNENTHGDCQTDGHYLCSNCIHIASFKNMELSDNCDMFYPKDQKIFRMTELLKEMDEYLRDAHPSGNKSAKAINTISTNSEFHYQIRSLLK